MSLREKVEKALNEPQPIKGMRGPKISELLLIAGVMIGIYTIAHLANGTGERIPFLPNDRFVNSAPSGKVWPVKRWLDQHMNDPKSIQFAEWGRVEYHPEHGQHLRSCGVIFRAKNGFGAYQRKHWIFYAEFSEGVAYIMTPEGKPVEGLEDWQLRTF